MSKRNGTIEYLYDKLIVNEKWLQLYTVVEINNKYKYIVKYSKNYHQLIFLYFLNYFKFFKIWNNWLKNLWKTTKSLKIITCRLDFSKRTAQWKVPFKKITVTRLFFSSD